MKLKKKWSSSFVEVHGAEDALRTASGYEANESGRLENLAARLDYLQSVVANMLTRLNLSDQELIEVTMLCHTFDLMDAPPR